MKRVGLLFSVLEEGMHLGNLLPKKSLLGGKPLYKGRLYGKEIFCIISGMGKTNAAHATTLLIEKVSPDMVILFGVGGAYPGSGLKVGDVAIAEKEVYGDEGVLTKDGFQGTDAIGIPLLRRSGKRYFNEFPLDKSLTRKAAGMISPISPLPRGRFGGAKTKEAQGDLQIKSGTFVTVSTCTGTRRRAGELEKRHRAICENMEGAAVAHVCAIYGVPLIEIRGISNTVEDRDKSRWDIKLAVKNCQEVVFELLRMPS